MSLDTVVFDMETTGTSIDTGVLTIGLVAFDSSTEFTFDSLIEDGIELKLDIRQQLKSGRTSTPDTMQWWEKQGSEARRVLTPTKDDLSIEQAMDKIQEYFDKCGVNNNVMRGKVTYYCRAPHFDFSILKDLCNNIGRACVIPHLAVRDVRTVIDVLTGSSNGYVSKIGRDGFIKHNALHDSCNDAMQMLEAIAINQSNWELELLDVPF